jgi:CheY-like chemotaxis protein
VRVLVVDDEPSIRLALKRFFQREKWDVELADDGRAAIDRLLTSTVPAAPGVESDFDLIICDLRMPGCSGAELHARLMQSRPALLRRFVVVTGDAVSADAAEFIRRTACPVLHKPFELSALRALMHGEGNAAP